MTFYEIFNIKETEDTDEVAIKIKGIKEKLQNVALKINIIANYKSYLLSTFDRFIINNVVSNLWVIFALIQEFENNPNNAKELIVENIFGYNKIATFKTLEDCINLIDKRCNKKTLTKSNIII